MHYHAGCNIPGYMPEGDVETFSSFDEAKSYMIGELDRAGDHIFDSGEDEDERGIADAYSAAMEDLNLTNGPWWGETLPTSTSAHDLGCAYWITVCSETDCELDDRETFYVEWRGVEIIGEELTYADAVALLNSTCDTWEADGWTIERGWASSGNYAAAHCVKGDDSRMIAVEMDA